MGQKVHPTGFRLGISKVWNSRWFAEKDYSKLLQEDLRIRKFLKQRLSHAGISKVEIERVGAKILLSVHSARPGIIIGRKGAEIDTLKQEIQKMASQEVFINIVEVRKAEVDAQLVADNIANQLVRRVSFRDVALACGRVRTTMIKVRVSAIFSPGSSLGSVWDRAPKSTMLKEKTSTGVRSSAWFHMSTL